jgi:hypothetical protein
MSNLLSIIFELAVGMASNTSKGVSSGIKKAGFNKSVFYLCTVIWLCVVFALSID